MTHISQNVELREAQVSAVPLSWLQVSHSESCPGLCILVIYGPKIYIYMLAQRMP